MFLVSGIKQRMRDRGRYDKYSESQHINSFEAIELINRVKSTQHRTQMYVVALYDILRQYSGIIRNTWTIACSEVTVKLANINSTATSTLCSG